MTGVLCTVYGAQVYSSPVAAIKTFPELVD